MSELGALLERVRAATGPDTQLDHDIMNACGFACRQDFINDCGNWFWFDKNGERFEHLGSSRKLTSSIDAALALVEKLLPGWRWLVRSPHPPKDRYFARLESPDFEDLIWEAGDKETRDILKGTEALARAATAPLALIAALLTALISQESTNE